MLCFLMSIIGSAWGQETYTISFNGSIVQTPNGSNFFTCNSEDYKKEKELYEQTKFNYQSIQEVIDLFK